MFDCYYNECYKCALANASRHVVVLSLKKYQSVIVVVSIMNFTLTLSPLKPSYDGHSSGNFQKFAVYTVLELCTHCRYQHMCIELLYLLVSLICCLEVHLVQ